jgi:hypothetical protein
VQDESTFSQVEDNEDYVMQILPTIASSATHLSVSELRRLEGRPVLRLPEQLRLHPVLEEFDFLAAEDLNNSAELKRLAIPEPIVITTNGTILAGFGAWRLANLEREEAVHCIEYAIGEEEILPFILRYHQPRRAWNAFARISVARRLKFDLQQRALDNMRVGGKYKGSTNLPKADRIDVRQKIATLAGTGTGNVTKVEAILDNAHPNIVVALQNGLLSIHQAWKWCKLSKTQQKEEFARHEEEYTRRKILREFSVGESSTSLDPVQVIEALQHKESLEPGSITIRTSLSKRTTIVLGEDLLGAMDAQRELNQIA